MLSTNSTIYHSNAVPSPVSVYVENITNPEGGPLFISSEVTSHISLVCTVTLSALLDIPVSVEFKWTGPKGYASDSTQSIMQHTITDMVTISPLALENAGVYVCEATIMKSNPTNIYIVGTGTSESTTNVALCKFYTLQEKPYKILLCLMQFYLQLRSI